MFCFCFILGFALIFLFKFLVVSVTLEFKALLFASLRCLVQLRVLGVLEVVAFSFGLREG